MELTCEQANDAIYGSGYGSGYGYGYGSGYGDGSGDGENAKDYLARLARERTHRQPENNPK